MDKKTMQFVKFISSNLNEITCDTFGTPRTKYIDKVFEDLFGKERLIEKAYDAHDLQKILNIFQEIGFHHLFNIFDSEFNKNILIELVNAVKRIYTMKKNMKKLYKRMNSSKKKKHREKDVIAYKSYAKELKYAEKVYADALKTFKKELGIKKKKNGAVDKERYSKLKEYSKKKNDSFEYGDENGSWSLYSLATDSSYSDDYPDFMDSSDNDDILRGGGNYERYISSSMNKERANTVQRRHVKENLPDFISREDDIYEDDDDYSEEHEEDDDRISEISDKVDALARKLSAIYPSQRDTHEENSDIIKFVNDALTSVSKNVSELSTRLDANIQRTSQIVDYLLEEDEEDEESTTSEDNDSISTPIQSEDENRTILRGEEWTNSGKDVEILNK